MIRNENFLWVSLPYNCSIFIQLEVFGRSHHIRNTMGKNQEIPGIIFAIQTFGDYSRWHPHLYALVADRLFTDSGYFYVMPRMGIRPLAALFRASVLTMLKKEGLIDDSFIK